jgi:transposase-like protein
MEYLVLGGRGRVVLNDRKARELLERVRWPEGPICPHCVVVGGHYRVIPKKSSRSPVREGVWKCRDCRKQFTVTVGTVFQGSKIPLSKWVTAIHLMGDPAKGVNAHQLHTRLGLTYKSARFMAGRIAESLRQGAIGRKLNSLLEAEGVRLVRKRAKKAPGGAKKQPGAARKTVSRKGKARSGGSGRRKSSSRKAPGRKR